MNLKNVCSVLLVCLCGCGERVSEPVEGVLRVMPLGDSITEGNRQHNSYRRPLWLSLREAGYTVDFVGSSQRNHLGGPPSDDFDGDHEGHWGWRVDEVLARLPEWAAAAKPDVVLIHLGSNDLFQGEPADQIIAELEQVFAVLRGVNPRVALFVAELIPAAGMEAQIRDLNARIRSLATGADVASPVFVVDQFTGFDPARHTYDGVHPNAEGEVLISSRWFEVLKRDLVLNQ
jgi:lysophospholipase L1-like esterase